MTLQEMGEQLIVATNWPAYWGLTGRRSTMHEKIKRYEISR